MNGNLLAVFYTNCRPLLFGNTMVLKKYALCQNMLYHLLKDSIHNLHFSSAYQPFTSVTLIFFIFCVCVYCWLVFHPVFETSYICNAEF